MKHKVWSICFCLLLLSGCNGYKEINRLTFIVGMGIDKVGNRYRVTFQCTLPNQISSASSSSGASQGIPVINYTSEGKTLSEAARNNTKKIARESYYGHIILVVVGEEVAKENLLKVLDVFERDSKVRVGTPIIITRHSSAEAVLNALTPSSKIQSLDLNNKMQNTEKALGENANNSVYEVIQNIENPGVDVTISGVELPANSKNMNKKDHLDQTHPSVPLINGTALFRRGKLVHWVTGKKSRALLLANNKLEGTNVSVPCGKDQYVSVALSKSRLKKKVKVVNSTPDVTFEVKAAGAIDEVMCDQDFTKMTTIKKIEKEVAKTIQKEIQEMFSISQTYRADVFAIGRTLYESNPKQWKQYGQDWRGLLLPKARAHVHVSVSIKGTGMRSNSVLFDEK